MADVAGEIDAEPAFAAFQELREGLEFFPRDTAQCDGIHVFDGGEDALEERAIFGLGRGHREAAVAGDHRRHTMVAGHGGVRIEGDLRVVVRVDVDDSRGDDLPVASISRSPVARRQMSEPGHAAVA